MTAPSVVPGRGTPPAEIRRSISLTDAETICLDGRCSEAVQVKVDEAKARLAAARMYADLPAALAGFIADVVQEARTVGRLVFSRQRIDACQTCGKVAAFCTYPRSTRSHRKGDINYGARQYLGGVDLAYRSVVFRGHVTLGCCMDCFAIVQPALCSALADVPAAIPAEITGHAPTFIRREVTHCTKCDWRGHEGQMGQLPALMGGYYRGECPNCHAQNRPFGPTIIKTTPKEFIIERDASVPLPPRYWCMACPLTFVDADTANAHHDATGHNQTWREWNSFAERAASVPSRDAGGADQ